MEKRAVPSAFFLLFLLFLANRAVGAESPAVGVDLSQVVTYGSKILAGNSSEIALVSAGVTPAADDSAADSSEVAPAPAEEAPPPEGGAEADSLQPEQEQGTMEQEVQPPPEVPPQVPPQSPPPVLPGPQPGGAGPGIPPEKKYLLLNGALQAFREYKGEKTPQALMALVESMHFPGARQEPPAVLSDGRSRATFFIDAPPQGTSVKSFYLRGAHLLSLKTEGTLWVLEVRPVKGVHEASVSVLSNGSTTEIPMTVAPPLPVRPGLQDFSDFLKGAGKTAAVDLNNDGKKNYIDEYIYTVNYLAARRLSPGSQ